MNCPYCGELAHPPRQRCKFGEQDVIDGLIARVNREAGETFKEQLDRLHAIASGDRDCDMSENDLAALRAVLMTFDAPQEPGRIPADLRGDHRGGSR